ncbi:MAG: hypothetical protein LUH41_06605 [Clostridiales bacterium]|nr:hypothetical protein [Clostridiales bacterium]
MEEFISTNMSYIVSVVCALVAGFASYFCACKKAKAEMKQLEKKYELDMENERKRFEMEKEKMEIEHKHQLELQQKEFASKLGADLISEAMKLPEVKERLSQGVRNSNNRNKRRK